MDWEKIMFYLEGKVRTFSAGCISQAYPEWSLLTSDPEVLQTVEGMHIDVISSLPNTTPFQYSFNEVETEFVHNEIKNLIQKKVITQTNHEPGEFLSPRRI